MSRSPSEGRLHAIADLADKLTDRAADAGMLRERIERLRASWAKGTWDIREDPAWTLYPDPIGELGSQLRDIRHESEELAVRLRQALEPVWNWTDSPVVGWSTQVKQTLFDLYRHFHAAWERFPGTLAKKWDDLACQRADEWFAAFENPDTVNNLGFDACNLKDAVLRETNRELYSPDEGDDLRSELESAPDAEPCDRKSEDPDALTATTSGSEARPTEPNRTAGPADPPPEDREADGRAASGNNASRQVGLAECQAISLIDPARTDSPDHGEGRAARSFDLHQIVTMVNNLRSYIMCLRDGPTVFHQSWLRGMACGALSRLHELVKSPPPIDNVLRRHDDYDLLSLKAINAIIDRAPIWSGDDPSAELVEYAESLDPERLRIIADTLRWYARPDPAALASERADPPRDDNAILRPSEFASPQAPSEASGLAFICSTQIATESDYVDPLPRPESLTVAGAMWLIETSARISSALTSWTASESRVALERVLASVDATGLVERLRLANDPAPILKDALERRGTMLFESPGIADLERFANNECNSPLSLPAAQEFRRRLAKLLGKTWSEVGAMPLVEAVGRVSHPQRPNLPRADEHSVAREAPAAGPLDCSGDSAFAIPIRPPSARTSRHPDSERIAAGPADSERKALGRQAGRTARKVPRGELDERAVALLLKNPTLNNSQLAEALGCREGTLRDKAKCPKLAMARASIRAQREAFRGGSTWCDRRPDDDET